MTEILIYNTISSLQPQDCVLNQTAMISILAISLLFTFLNTVMSGFVTKFGRKRLFIGIQVRILSNANDEKYCDKNTLKSRILGAMAYVKLAIKVNTYQKKGKDINSA